MHYIFFWIKQIIRIRSCHFFHVLLDRFLRLLCMLLIWLLIYFLFSFNWGKQFLSNVALTVVDSEDSLATLTLPVFWLILYMLITLFDILFNPHVLSLFFSFYLFFLLVQRVKCESEVLAFTNWVLPSTTLHQSQPSFLWSFFLFPGRRTSTFVYVAQATMLHCCWIHWYF